MSRPHLTVRCLRSGLLDFDTLHILGRADVQNTVYLRSKKAAAYKWENGFYSPPSSSIKAAFISASPYPVEQTR